MGDTMAVRVLKKAGGDTVCANCELADTPLKRVRGLLGRSELAEDEGMLFLPAAMRNFLALLGWSPGEDREIMSGEEMISLFSLEGIQKKPAVFDTVKLEWMNGQYLSRLPAAELVEPVRRELEGMGLAPGGADGLELGDRLFLDTATMQP